MYVIDIIALPYLTNSYTEFLAYRANLAKFIFVAAAIRIESTHPQWGCTGNIGRAGSRYM